MKSKRAIKSALKVAAFLFAVLSLSLNSLMPSFAAGNNLYFPLISRILPGGPGINSPLLITEVLYNPSDLEPGAEWIELFNRGTEPINLGSHKIGDSEIQGDAEGMYYFPQASTIPPGGVLIIANQALIFSQNYGFLPDFEFNDSSSSVADMKKYRSWAGGIVNLSNSGDEILLLDKGDSILDSLSWGNSSFVFSYPVPPVDDGHSIERRPADTDRNHAGDWWDQSTPHPGDVDLLPSTPAQTETLTPIKKDCGSASLLISELLYDPIGVSEPSGEWLEVYNYRDAAVNLGCIKIGDEENLGGGEGMYIFPSGSLLAVGEVAVIANRGDKFFSVYGFYPRFEFNESVGEIPDMVKYSSWATGRINLNKSGDELLLLDDDDNLVDTVSWGSSTFAFDPPNPGVDEGNSLERRPADYDSDTAGDWNESTNPDPGQVDLTVPTLPPSPTSTQTPTPTLGPVFVINEIHADPHSDLGDANGDGGVDIAEDEFVELINISPAAINITGWILRDAVGVLHVFPTGSEIAPGCGIIIFGGGVPTGSFGNCLVQVASTENLGLNDLGDVISLIDGDSSEVSTYSYGAEAGYGQSITRDPDVSGDAPLIKHSTATGSGGSLFSPGTRVDGGFFSGCTE